MSIAPTSDGSMKGVGSTGCLLVLLEGCARFAGSLEPLGRRNGDSSKIRHLAIRRTIRIGDHQELRDYPDSLLELILELGLRHEVLLL